MRILLVYRVNQYSKKMAGVFNKLIGQLEGFEDSGFEVYALYMAYGTQTLSSFSGGKLLPIKSWQDISVENEKKQFWFNGIEATEICSPDAVYVRYDKMYESALLTDYFASPELRRPITCLEFATYPYADEIACGVKRESDRQNRESLRPYIDLIFSTSENDQILGLENHYFNNQLNSRSFELSSKSRLPLFDNDSSIHFLSVANMSPWHGYDRLIKGLHSYKKSNPKHKVIYHIVGHGESSPELQKLVEKLDLADWVMFHGHLSGKELVACYDTASVAIGSLGLHRINIFRSCILKNREYLANGLPIVSASKDDALESIPWKVNVPPDDTDIDVLSIVNFVTDTNKMADIREQIREYARGEFRWRGFADMVKRQVADKILQKDKCEEH